MGKATRRKQEAELQKELPYIKVLQTQKTYNVTKQPKDKAKNLEKAKDWFMTFRDSYINFEKNDIANFNVLSFNEYSLRKSIIRFMYVKYNVPEFLFKYFVDNVTRKKNDPAFVWFLQITSGASFYKMNKDSFTKKEAHLYLHAPDHLTPFENIIWARCKARGLPPRLTEILYKHRIISTAPRNKRWCTLIEFLVRNLHRKITRDVLNDVIDYVSRQPADWSFTGRTWSSVVRLSRRWHRNSHWTSYATPYMEWERHGQEINCEIVVEYIPWQFVELMNSEQLLDESVAQDHCVVTYKQSCASGSCRIVSMRQDGKRCLTIEISHNTIVQVRGKYNRAATKEEIEVLKLWSRKFGLRSKWH